MLYMMKKHFCNLKHLNVQASGLYLCLLNEEPTQSHALKNLLRIYLANLPRSRLVDIVKVLVFACTTNRTGISTGSTILQDLCYPIPA